MPIWWFAPFIGYYILWVLLGCYVEMERELEGHALLLEQFLIKFYLQSVHKKNMIFKEASEMRS